MVRRLALALLLLACSAGAQDMEGLLKLLARAQRLEWRGQVESSVFFPPRPEPTKLQEKLPHLAFLPGLLRRNFEVSGARPDSVAGRGATRYDLSPKAGDADRWSVWLDADGGALLGFQERGEAGEVVREAKFESVQGKPRPRPAGNGGRANGPELRAAVLDSLPGLKLPAQFVPASAKLTKRGLEILLTDGLNTLALVLASRGVKLGEGVAARRVAGQFVWLVGHLPQEQLRAAIAGIKDVRTGALGTFLPPSDSNR